MDRSVGELEVMDSENKPGPLEWDYLDPSLKALLPSEEGLTYVITEFNHLPTENFPGAPEYSYEATVRINLTDRGGSVMDAKDDAT